MHKDYLNDFKVHEIYDTDTIQKHQTSLLFFILMDESTFSSLLIKRLLVDSLRIVERLLRISLLHILFH